MRPMPRMTLVAHDIVQVTYLFSVADIYTEISNILSCNDLFNQMMEKCAIYQLFFNY
jgi:hypothetical protein